MSKGDKTIICRVCLRSDIKIRKKCISLFERHKDALICDNISSIANVVIKQNDGLPSEICPDCLLELDTAVTFKAKCENSNIILLGTLPGNQITQLTEFSIDMKLEQIKKEEPDDYVDDKDFEVEYLDTDVDFGLDLDQIGKQETQIETLNAKPNKETQFECHDCGEFFKSKCKLKVHWKRVHLLEKLVCETCKRAFKSTKAYLKYARRDSRDKHVRAKHNFLFSNMNNFIVKKEKPPINPSDENEKVFIEVDVAPILTTIKSEIDFHTMAKFAIVHQMIITCDGDMQAP
ncbi:uncharacterized protein LOC135078179 [Ostrinia nubilalis]|uniref:uncharacterized protein LOC135078179 n=1 Tax=Ostrinia nubilalis TaxID=29057 RepID=UPI00308268E3